MANTIDKKSAAYDLYGSSLNTTEKEEYDYITEKIKEMNHQIQQLKKMAKTSSKSAASNIASSFNPTLEMNKIACATTPAQLRRYISGINAKISLLKKSGGYDTLIKRFRKIISKAEEKITNLKREETMEKKAKELERIRKLEESKKIREKKEIAKRHRKLKEAEDVRNAEAITFVPEGTGVGDVSAAGVEASIQSVDVSVSADVGTVSVSADAGINVTA